MPRFNVQNPVTKKWRCFSTIVDDWVTDWMVEAQYELWRREEYGKNCGSVYDANRMTIEDAERAIKLREEFESGEE